MNDIQAKQEEDRRRIRRRHGDKVEVEDNAIVGTDTSAYIRMDATYSASSGVVGGSGDANGETF